jgi:predicted PurR-regulated permease PerM
LNVIADTSNPALPGQPAINDNTVLPTPDPAAHGERMPITVHSAPLMLLTVLAVIFVLDWAQEVFVPLLLGVILSYALSPAVSQMERWRIPRALGAALLLALIVGMAGAATYSLHVEASGMIDTLPQSAQKFRQTLRREWSGSDGTIDKMQKAATQIERAASESTATPNAPQGVTRVLIESPKFNIRDYLWNGTRGLLSAMSLVVVVLFLVYFLLASGDFFRRKIVKLSGPTLARKKITVQMLNEISSQVQRYLLVQLFTSALVGVASWLAFMWLGLQHAAVWGIVAGVLNLIPYLGAIIITGVTGVVGFMQFGNMQMAASIAAASLAIHTVQGNLLAPWLTGRASRMHAVVVFVSVLFWGWLWGAWGLLLGMPIMMAIKTVCDHVEEFKPVGEFLGD